jgi:hypothetical protein
MKQFFLAVGTGLLAILLGVAKYFQMKSERLEAKTRERDARERETVAKMEEQRAAVIREYLEQKPIDPKKRDYFE